MNTLPPLPLIDGCLFIDNSGWMESLSTCHRLVQYKSLLQRVPTTEKASLNFGSAIHLALEHRYRKYRHSDIGTEYYNELNTILSEFYNEHPCPIDDWRNINWCFEVVKKYNEKYAIEEFGLLQDESGKVMVELPFAIELYRHRIVEDSDIMPAIAHPEIPIIYTGKIDLPLMFEGAIWVMDHKSTSSLGAQFFDRMRMSSQQKGYCWAFEKLTGKKVMGYVVNAIRTKEPPQYVIKGTEWRGGNSRGEAKKMSPQDWWNESLQRERYTLKDGELIEWKHNTIAMVEEFFYNYSKGYLPMETALGCTAYGRCPYYGVCTLPPSDRDLLLQSGLFTNHTWSPLIQPTQSMQ